MKPGILLTSLLLFMVLLSACAGIISATPTPTAAPEWESGNPREGQPDFPELSQYWVIDNGCGFDRQKIRTADAMFEKLRNEGIAEVAIICQPGIVDKGPTNNDKIWLRDWGRWAKMGDADTDRSVVWLIRPDAKEEEQKVTVEVSRWLYWYTAMDYAETLKVASNYANVKDYNGALVAITRGADHRLRQLWETHNTESE